MTLVIYFTNFDLSALTNILRVHFEDEMGFLAFEHKLLAQLKGDKNYPGQSLCAAVSGGVDSMALLTLLNALKKPLSLDLKVLHVHHGPTRNKQLKEFRLKSWKLVREYCQQNNIPFLSNLESVTLKGKVTKYDFNLKPEKSLTSEAELREFRHRVFKKFVGQKQRSIVFAHHAEDLLETQLIQLIRGSGALGLGALKSSGEMGLRPLLGCTKQELVAYARAKKTKWVQDPSNVDLKPLRNWLRHKWLPELEKKRPGAMKSLGSSLQNLLTKTQNEDFLNHSCLSPEGILRAEFSGLSLSERKQILACYMNRLKLKSYTTGHINEILKRLDSPEKKLNFRLLKCTWIIDARRIKAIPNSGSKGTR